MREDQPIQLDDGVLAEEAVWATLADDTMQQEMICKRRREMIQRKSSSLKSPNWQVI